jgi:flagellar biosynthesis/type III secretory pathway protein FliH
MKGFKEKTFADRLQEAANARKAALERFRSRPSLDDPEVVKRREERMRIAALREERLAARKAEKEAEAAARAEQEAIERAEREARERREAVEKLIRDAAEAAERKAARDARYAARKARQGQKKRSG